MVEKLIRDGMVAVLWSPGFGAGWSTWHYEDQEAKEFMVFDKSLCEAVLDDRRDLAIEIMKEKFGEERPYTGGAGDLKVLWVKIGQRFQINEYDGSESIQILGPDVGHLA